MARPVIGTVAAWGAMLFNLGIVPGLLWTRMRPYAFGLAVAFHVANEFIFSIALFPYFAIALTTIFLSPSWPRRFLRLPAPEQPRIDSASPMWMGCLLATYCIWQTVMPLRHHLYPGPVGWSEEGHLYSWRMKLRSKSGHNLFWVHDLCAGTLTQVDPSALLTSSQVRGMVGRPDLIHQFAIYLGNVHASDTIETVAVYADSWASWNYRPDERLIALEVDLLRMRRTRPPRSYILPAPGYSWPPYPALGSSTNSRVP